MPSKGVDILEKPDYNEVSKYEPFGGYLWVIC